MYKVIVIGLTALSLSASALLFSASPSSSSAHSTIVQPKKDASPPAAVKPLPSPNKEGSAGVAKPFGMPGVVGLQKGQWLGTDYLGFVSDHIGIDVEVLKGENTPEIPSAEILE